MGVGASPSGGVKPPTKDKGIILYFAYNFNRFLIEYRLPICILALKDEALDRKILVNGGHHHELSGYNLLRRILRKLFGGLRASVIIAGGGPLTRSILPKSKCVILVSRLHGNHAAVLWGFLIKAEPAYERLVRRREHKIPTFQLCVLMQPFLWQRMRGRDSENNNLRHRMIHDTSKHLYCQSVCRTGFVRSRRARKRIGPNLKNSSAGLGISRSGEPRPQLNARMQVVLPIKKEKQNICFSFLNLWFAAPNAHIPLHDVS